jgi:hypothetical protein
MTDVLIRPRFIDWNGDHPVLGYVQLGSLETNRLCPSPFYWLPQRLC